MFKKILIGTAVFVAGFIVVVVMQPSEFTVARSAVIAAPAGDVFAQVNDFHNWDHWSPWAKIDPAMKQSFEGAPSGAGAIYSWAGNNEVGEGRMTLTESQEAALVRIKLEFFKPFSATNTAEFSFTQEGTGTRVDWSMSGKKNFIEKAVCLFINMDKMVGKDFEKGLARMKSYTEAAVEK
jgi:hypothetical protein